jgi:hypothetical protein
MKIIGDKSTFAIEYEITDINELMGNARIWFNDEYIGSKKELIYLKSYLLDNLKQISRKQNLDMLIGDDIIETFNKLKKRLDNLDDSEIRKYLVSFGTLSDDYLIFSFMTADNYICVLWKLVGEYPYFDDINYNDRKIKFIKILKDKYLIELSKIEKEIMKPIKRN